MDYTVSSSRILRDHENNSRGVGFARFAPYLTEPIALTNWIATVSRAVISATRLSGSFMASPLVRKVSSFKFVMQTLQLRKTSSASPLSADNSELTSTMSVLMVVHPLIFSRSPRLWQSRLHSCLALLRSPVIFLPDSAALGSVRII